MPLKEYSYIDPDGRYTDKNTGVLFNKADIKEADILLVFESFKVSERLEQLHAKPIKVKAAADLLKIHKFLFQDVYGWAGEVRKVEISKSGRQFLYSSRFPMAFGYLDSLLGKYFGLDAKDKRKVAEGLADILDNINELHPFREGNGRTQREFLRTLALEKGYTLDLNPPDNKDIYDRYMHGTIKADIGVLQELIFEVLKPV